MCGLLDSSLQKITNYMFDTFTSTQISLRYISLRYMLGLFGAFTSTQNLFGLCTSTQDFTSIYAIRLNIIRNNHHCRLFHFDSDFHLDSFTSTLDFTSIHLLRPQVSLRFIDFGNSKRKNLSLMSVHALR